MSIKHHAICHFIAWLAIFTFLAGCGNPDTNAANQRLNEQAAAIDKAIMDIRQGLARLQSEAERIMAIEPEPVDLGNIPPKYQFYEEKVFYKAEDDGLCGMWASGFTPIGPKEVARIIEMEKLHPAIKSMVRPEWHVALAYILTTDHVGVYYPYFNGLSFFEPGVNFYESYKPFYEAAPQNNPERLPVTIDPYLDVTGNGYTVSFSRPVYVNGQFMAAVGCDLPLLPLAQKHMDTNKLQLFMTDTTLLIALTKGAGEALGLQGLSKFYYLKRVETDESVPQHHRLEQHENPAIREFAKLVQEKPEFKWTLNDKSYQVISSKIVSVNWYLVELVAL